MRKLLSFIVLVLFSLGITTASVNSAEVIPGQANRIGNLWKLHASRYPCLTADQLPQDLLQPPVRNGGKLPVPVGISLHINEIPEISDTRNQFQLDGYITALDNIASKYSSTLEFGLTDDEKTLL